VRSRTAILAILIVLGLVAFYILGPQNKATNNRAAAPTPETPADTEHVSPPPTEVVPVTVAATVPRPSEFESVEALPGRIVGKVFDGEGYPANGVVISASWAPPREGRRGLEWEPLETTTGDTGTFVLDNLPLGRHYLIARQDEDTARGRCLLLAHAPVAEIVLLLKPRHSIAGSVVVPNRARVPQATLYPVLNNGKAISEENSIGQAIHTDENGAFHFDAPDPGAWEFLALAADYAPTRSQPISTGTEDARIQLQQGVAVSGRVIQDATNAPVAGVNIQLAIDQLPGPPLRVESDTAGAFTFNAVAPGDYLVDVRAEAQTLSEAPMHLAVENAPVTDLVLRLVTGGVIRGTVLVQETQEPLVGIAVQARRTGSDSALYVSGPTGVQGEFEFVGLPSGEYVINTKWLRGFAMVGRSKDEATVHLQPGQIVEGVTLALHQGLTISGRVLDSEGNPVAGADVRGRGVGWQDQQTSDADGSFILANLTPELEVTLSAATSTFTSGLQGPMTIPEAGLQDIELILSQRRDALIAGVVVDKQRRPVVAKVIAWPDDGQVVDFPPMDDSDALGRFVLPNVAPGDYRLTVKPGQGQQIEALRVHVEPEQQLRDLQLVYPEAPDLAIAGQIVGPDGTGVSCSMTVYRQDGVNSMFQATASTTLEGGFRIEGLTAGTYGITVNESPGFQGGHVNDVEAGSEDIQIILEPALRLSGQVSDASGNPITDFEIALDDSGALPTSNSIRRREFQSVSHPEGRFEIDVAQGSYSVRVRAEGYDIQEFRVGSISADATAEDLHFVLQ
jgi:protocatechuate 3,4-dioxygenase beta subunit